VPDSPSVRPLRMFLHAYIVTALNPKSIVFFVAGRNLIMRHPRPSAGVLVVIPRLRVAFKRSTASRGVAVSDMTP